MKTIFFSLAIMLFSGINAFCGESLNVLKTDKEETVLKSIVIKTDESNIADLQKMAADFDAAHQVKECEISLTASVKMGFVEVEISVTVSGSTCTEAASLAVQGLSDAKKAVLAAFY
jgi:hypothetical protein